MNMIAVTNQDIGILAAMLLAIAAGLGIAFVVRSWFAKIGTAICVTLICIGLSNSGWSPLFGGTHHESTYFGTTMLTLGLIGALAFGAIDDGVTRVLKSIDDRQGDPNTPRS